MSNDSDILAKVRSKLPLDALKFLAGYAELVEIVDDIQDEEASADVRLRAGAMYTMVLSSNYYARNAAQLWVVDLLVNNQYADSVAWEKSSEPWKRRDAKVLSHAAHLMLYAVILLEVGYDFMREVSAELREDGHLKHLGDLTPEEMEA